MPSLHPWTMYQNLQKSVQLSEFVWINKTCTVLFHVYSYSVTLNVNNNHFYYIHLIKNHSNITKCPLDYQTFGLLELELMNSSCTVLISFLQLVIIKLLYCNKILGRDSEREREALQGIYIGISWFLLIISSQTIKAFIFYS